MALCQVPESNILRCGDVLLEVYVSEKEQAVEKRVRIFCILWRKVAL